EIDAPVEAFNDGPRIADAEIGFAAGAAGWRNGLLEALHQRVAAGRDHEIAPRQPHAQGLFQHDIEGVLIVDQVRLAEGERYRATRQRSGRTVEVATALG